MAGLRDRMRTRMATRKTAKRTTAGNGRVTRTAERAKPEPEPVPKPKGRMIEVPRPTMMVVEAELRGLPPGLIVNPFDQKAKAMLLASMQKGKARLALPDKDPEKDYEELLEALAVNGSDSEAEPLFWLDVRAFKKAMCRGAKSVDRLPMTDFRSGVFVVEDSVINQRPAAHIRGVPERYTDRVNNVGGKPDLRTRLLLPEWAYTVRFIVNTSILSVDQAVTCLVNAGVGTGVGDWRVEKDGVHGRWEVVSAAERPIAAG